MSKNKMTTQSQPHTEADLPIQDLVPKAIECAEALLEADSVLLASHIDADGLTSAGVAATLLKRSDTPFETKFCKQLDADKIESIAQTNHSTVLFTDFGSGQLDEIIPHEEAGDFTPIIADHHEPVDGVDTEYHLNPLKYGINGSSELSGAGTVYVLARCMAHVTDNDTPQQNKDLSALALVGATGDMQGSAEGMSGANVEIVDEGVKAGVITEKKDLTLYGKQSRPLPKLLEYSTDIRIPRITGSEAGATQFLDEIDINFTESDGTWRRWVDLTDEEKQTVASNLIQTAIERGVPNYRVDQIIGTTYELPQEEERTALRDVSEFSTLLNATARYEQEDVGLAVCLGDRNEAYKEAKKLLKNHQKNISQGVELVVEEGVTKESNLQWFDAGTKIRETIVGIIAGMALGEDGIDRDTPIIAFAAKESEEETDEEELKVSSRGNRTLTNKGLDLSVVMEQAAEFVGGGGGGHDIAAGASIPKENRDDFIKKANEIIKKQLS